MGNMTKRLQEQQAQSEMQVQAARREQEKLAQQLAEVKRTTQATAMTS